jgi:hypothetical protein
VGLPVPPHRRALLGRADHAPRAAGGASTAAPRPPAVACAARDYLRAAPGAGVIGSIGTGEPLRVLRGWGGWRKVATEFGATGWLPALDLCG